MAKEPKAPQTAAVRVLRALDVPFTAHLYDYEARGGAPHAAEALGLPLEQVVKTIVLEDESGRGLIALQHGDRDISTQALARHLGVKRIQPASPAAVTRLTGYQVGGTSPFGTRKGLPVYVEASVLHLPRAYINGGKRGFLMGLDPEAVTRVLHAEPVSVATEKTAG